MSPVISALLAVIAANVVVSVALYWGIRHLVRKGLELQIWHFRAPGSKRLHSRPVGNRPGHSYAYVRAGRFNQIVIDRRIAGGDTSIFRSDAYGPSGYGAQYIMVSKKNGRLWAGIKQRNQKGRTK